MSVIVSGTRGEAKPNKRPVQNEETPKSPRKARKKAE